MLSPAKGIELPPLKDDFTADPVELCFDLAFVFAFSQLVSLLVHLGSTPPAVQHVLTFRRTALSGVGA
jgi:low temperature requirement protein LtrA